MRIPPKNQIKHVYALDNGNGNLMAYRIDPNAKNPVAEPIVDKNGEPAGYAVKKDGTYIVGKMLENTDFVTYSDCAVMPINFKQIPTEENRETMLRYLEAWLKVMKGKCRTIEEDGQNAVWLVGCPTGWRSSKGIKEYQQIFIDAGYANPVIVYESNAAMVHFQKSSTIIETESEVGIVLCVDLGAYSNDATLVLPGRVKSYGGFVGASIIEKMIVAVNILEPDRYRKSKHVANDVQLTEAVWRRFETEPVFRSFMLLQGRWLKEKYFTNKKEGKLSNKDLSVQVFLDEYPAFREQEIFNLFVNIDMMQDIIFNRPICEVLKCSLFDELSLETRDEIGNKTWNDCLEGFLKSAAGEFKEFSEAAYSDNKDKKPVVILTGGASMMDFVQSVVSDEYPNIQLYNDFTAVTSIANGLADFASDKLKSIAFDQAFEDIIYEKEEDKDGEEQYVMSVKLVEAYEKFIFNTCVNVVRFERDALIDAINGWTRYKYDSDKISTNGERIFRENFTNSIIPELQRDSRESNDIIVSFINERFKSLLKDSGISDTQMFKEGEMHLEFTGIVIELMNKICEEVINTYNLFDKELADKFPNVGRGMFSDKRKEFINVNAEALNEILDNITDNTITWLKDIFYNDDAFRAFGYDSLLQIFGELKKKKRTLLGDLIVEEVFDEEDEEDQETDV